tara:strand:+ start:5929 stop:6804 length:876 start_codon:yes stop_codon:yes gene_type:complete
MKNNKLISEILRTQQLSGYNVALTLNEQTTGTTTGNTGMITCYGCPGHMQPLETKQFQGPAGAPPFNPDPNMNWGNWCGFGQSSGGYISYWEDQSLVSAICNSGTTGTNTGTTTGTTVNYGNSAVLEMCPGVPTNPTNVPNPFDTSANSLTIDGNPVTQADIGQTIQSGGGTKYTVQSVTPLTSPSQGNYAFTTSPGPCPRPIGPGTGTTGTTTGTTGGPTPPPPCNKTCQQLAPTFKKLVRINMAKRKNPKRWLESRIGVLTNKLNKSRGECKKKRLKCKIAVLKAVANK